MAHMNNSSSGGGDSASGNINSDYFKGDFGDPGFGMPGFGPSKFRKFGGGKAQRRCEDPNDPIEYKNLTLLQKYLTPQGKLQSRKRTKYCSQCQRELARAVKHARYLALLPYVV